MNQQRAIQFPTEEFGDDDDDDDDFTYDEDDYEYFSDKEDPDIIHVFKK